MGAYGTGGPAFPAPIPSSATGMTLRDWFAGQALAGIMAGGDTWASPDGSMKATKVCAAAYGLADAMIAARDK